MALISMHSFNNTVVWNIRLGKIETNYILKNMLYKNTLINTVVSIGKYVT